MQPAVRAHFRRSLVLAYAAPARLLAPLLPAYLTLDTYDGASDGKLRGFVAVAMVQTERLRPAFLPAWLGRGFFFVGYRVFVRYVDLRGRRLRGLYILRSATDSRLMTALGARLSTYAYRHVDAVVRDEHPILSIDSLAEGLHVEVDASSDGPVALPVGSPFPDWRVARRYAGPLPFTFGYDVRRSAVTVIEGVRSNWRPRPLAIRSAEVGALRTLTPDIPLALASAFEVTDVPYRWRAAYREPWPRSPSGS